MLSQYVLYMNDGGYTPFIFTVMCSRFDFAFNHCLAFRDSNNLTASNKIYKNNLVKPVAKKHNIHNGKWRGRKGKGVNPTRSRKNAA
jgi:hypothetical protein